MLADMGLGDNAMKVIGKILKNNFYFSKLVIIHNFLSLIIGFEKELYNKLRN